MKSYNVYEVLTPSIVRCNCIGVVIIVILYFDKGFKDGDAS